MASHANKRIRVDGIRIYLRTLEEKDANQNYCDWLNDPTVNLYLETRRTSIEELRKYIREKRSSPNCLFFGIFSKENGEHIGNIKLEPIDFERKRATLGLLIGDKKYWGKGFGTEAVKVLVDWAFNSLGIEELDLGVISENAAAIKVYQKAGFHIEKVEKNAVRHDDKLYDRVVMAIKRV
jgi:RimJ/RimL family protein N-acetyltransferase